MNLLLKKIYILNIFCLISIVSFSQNWKIYSDSVLFYFKEKNDTTNTIRCLRITDSLLELNKHDNDTTFADYLYRKGVVISSLYKADTILLKDALAIWEKSNYKNDVKVMKIYYFLGSNYYLLATKGLEKYYYDSSNFYFSKSFKLIKKYNLESISNYKVILHLLTLINYLHLKNYKLASYYCEEYIEYTKIKGVDLFDFNYVDAYKYQEDRERVEIILKGYIESYNELKINSPEILFKIYYELAINKNIYLGNQLKFFEEIIQYGLKAIDIYDHNKLKNKLEYSLLCSYLENAYDAKLDRENARKYRELSYENETDKNKIDAEINIQHFYDIEEFPRFKMEFDKYENELIKNKKYDDLLELYSYSIKLFAKNILFSKDSVLGQLNLIEKNKDNLSARNKIVLNLQMARVYAISGLSTEAIEICNKNINISDTLNKLAFYKIKSISELALGYFKLAKQSNDSAINIASNYYGSDDIRMLPFYSDLIMLESGIEKKYLIELTNKIIKLIYKANLENKSESAQLWNSIGKVMLKMNNIKDGGIYFEKAIKILEYEGGNQNPFLYYACLVSLSQVYNLEANYVEANIQLSKAKNVIENLSGFKDVAYADYYQALGLLNFHQDKFYEAKEAFEISSKLYHDSTYGQLNLFILLCDYFISGNDQKAISKLEEYQNIEGSHKGSMLFLYLLKYKSKNKIDSRNLLINYLDKIISESNKYYNIISNEEKENFYKSNSIYFELLNSHLKENDSVFLNQYIKFRFYSKSILQQSTFNSNYDYQKNNNLLNEYRNNSILINHSIESNFLDKINIEQLKSKNREIERLIPKVTDTFNHTNLDQLRNILKSNEGYVEIIKINKQHQMKIDKPGDMTNFFSDTILYGAIIITKYNSPKFIFLDTTNKLEIKYVPDFKFKIVNKQENLESYKYLFEKIDSELKNINKIYLVNDGVYNSINIESIYNPIKKMYIVDYLRVQQITNVNSLVKKNYDNKLKANATFALFGNPKYNIEKNNSENIPEMAIRGFDDSSLLEMNKYIQISSLQGTYYEVLDIKEKLNKFHYAVSTYLNDSANEENIKKLNSPDILHIACHGYFLNKNVTSKIKLSISNIYNGFSGEDPYLKSGLLLSGAENTLNKNIITNSDENGILTASEVKELGLKETELVILSACETGLGINMTGEGVIGLSRAFMIAGANKVIMSLWPISDRKTQQLMVKFYENILEKNMRIEEALYQAKKEIKEMFPEPLYWAGFVLIK